MRHRNTINLDGLSHPSKTLYILKRMEYCIINIAQKEATTFAIETRNFHINQEKEKSSTSNII